MLVGMQSGAVIMESNLVGPQLNIITIRSSSSTPRDIPKRTEGICIHKYFYNDVHSATVCNSGRVKHPKRPSTDAWVDNTCCIQWDVVQS